MSDMKEQSLKEEALTNQSISSGENNSTISFPANNQYSPEPTQKSSSQLTSSPTLHSPVPKQNNLKNIIIVAVLIFIIGTGIGIFLYFTKNNQSSNGIPTDDAPEIIIDKTYSSTQEALEDFANDASIYYNHNSETNKSNLKTKYQNFISQNQDSDPDTVSSVKVMLASVYSQDNDLDSAINLLREDLTHPISDKKRYIVLVRLSDFCEAKGDTASQKQYIKELLQLNEPQPDYESWDAVKESYQAKLDELEKNQ